MKTLLSLIISGALVVSGYSQTRNVLVGTNNAVVQPTNFWSADATNARSGLGLGSAATNPASAFQPSSAVLSNLASSNGANLTNIPLSGVVGALATNGSAAGLTNFPASLLVTNGSGAGLTNLTAANITGTVGLASNVTGTIAISNGGSGSTTAGGAVSNLFTPNTPLVFTTNGQVVANTGTNQLTFTNGFSIRDAFSGENLDFVFTDESLGAGYGDSDFAIGVGADGFAVKYSSSESDWGQPILVTEGSGVVRFPSSTIDFIQPLAWNNASNAATTRTNLGLGWPALTNTNAGTGLVSVDTNGTVVSPTNFWQVAPIQTLVQDLTGITVSQTNNATNARNLYVYSLATNVSAISNTIILPTNAATFNGDEVTVIHKGTTNTTTVVRQAGSTNNLITLNRFDESVKFIRELGQWDFYHNISFVEPIQFSGTNASANAAASRTNLGLGSTNNVVFGGGFTNNVGVGVGGSNTGLASDGGLSGRLGLIKNGNIIAELSESGTFFGLYYPITFQGGNAVSNAATTRTNLGLGETNNVTFSALTLSSDLTLGGGDNIVLSTTNGTKIGTATNQLLGFYNQNPITQPSSTGVTTNGFTGGSGANVHPSSTFTGGIGTNAYTVSDIVAHLKSLGLIAP